MNFIFVHNDKLVCQVYFPVLMLTAIVDGCIARGDRLQQVNDTLVIIHLVSL